MKAKEIKGQSGENLAQTLGETEKHLFQLRFQSATDRLETPSEIRKARRDIARVKTLQREKELVKLGGLGTEQLGTRIAALAAKEAANAPGKRTAHRQGARLTRFYAAKGGVLPFVPPAPPAAAPVAKTETKTDAKKPDPNAKKTDAKKTGSAKGSGK